MTCGSQTVMAFLMSESCGQRGTRASLSASVPPSMEGKAGWHASELEDVARCLHSPKDCHLKVSLSDQEHADWACNADIFPLAGTLFSSISCAPTLGHSEGTHRRATAEFPVLCSATAQGQKERSCARRCFERSFTPATVVRGTAADDRTNAAPEMH